MDPSWPYGMEHASSGLAHHHHPAQHWHNHPSHGLGIQAIRADELEQRIFQHPDVLTHYSAVELYLRMDDTTLQSIYHLRENNPFGKDLSKLHASLFDSPPTDLFNLIYDLRLFNGYSATETLERFEASRRERRDQQDSHRRLTSKLRTAPKGLTYRCPSEKCRKTFQKSGHAKNHVENQHAEYLKLYPGWEPQQDLVSRSGSQSPVSDRQLEDVDVAKLRHQRPSVESPELSRPRRADVSVASSDTTNLNSLSPRSLVFSSSSGDGDTDSRRNSRLSPFLPMTPLGVDTSAMPSYYPSQVSLSPTLKRTRSPALLGDLSIYPGDFDDYSVPRHSVRHDSTAVAARRHSQKTRR